MSESNIKPWSENRTDVPPVLSPDLSIKNTRHLNPLAAPALYYELYDNNAEKIRIEDPKTGEVQHYELVANVNNPDSSSHFKIIKNLDTGHHILIAKGMDLPGRNEGAGRTGFTGDLYHHASAKLGGCLTDPVLDTERIYLELLRNPEVKSLETIGYSIGSIGANYLASVYGAKATNLADLGTPNSGIMEGMQKWMQANFNTCANGLFPGAYGAFKANLDRNVTGLGLRMDVMGGMLGGVGQRPGEQIVIDKDSIALSGIAHVPLVYAEAIANKVPDAPGIQATETSMHNTFLPFSKP